MKIVLLIENNRLFHPDFLADLFCSTSRDHHDFLVGIVTTLHPSATLPQRYSYFRRKLIAVGGVSGLVRILYKFSIKSNRLRFSSLRTVCRRHAVESFTTDDVNGEKSTQKIRVFQPDILFSFQGQILKRDLLQIPRFGCVNRHTGLLPKYRGVWPVFWALLNGDKECGITFHMMTEEIDDGPILCQEKITIRDDDTVFSLYERLFLLMPSMMKEILQNCERGRFIKIDNSDSLSTYYGFPKPEDVRALKEIAHRSVI